MVFALPFGWLLTSGDAERRRQRLSFERLIFERSLKDFEKVLSCWELELDSKLGRIPPLARLQNAADVLRALPPATAARTSRPG